MLHAVLSLEIITNSSLNHQLGWKVLLKEESHATFGVLTRTHQKASLNHAEQLAVQVISSDSIFADPCQSIAHRSCLLKVQVPVGSILLQWLKTALLHRNNSMQLSLQRCDFQEPSQISCMFSSFLTLSGCNP